jgi:hypothetical protein
MAIPQHTKIYPASVPPNSDVDFKTYEYIIGGKLVVGKAIMDEAYSDMLMSDDDARMQIKKKLISDMAQYILENNLVEFTMHDDPLSMRKAVMVRAYLAPNEQVKILRLANKIL